MSDFKEIVSHFNIDQTATEYGDGHINDTYLIEVTPYKYILQRINSEVFKRPEEVMENIEAVTSFLTEEIKKRAATRCAKYLCLLKQLTGKTATRHLTASITECIIS